METSIYLIKILLKTKSNLIESFRLILPLKEKICFEKFFDFYYLSNSVDFVSNQSYPITIKSEQTTNWSFFQKKYRFIPIDILPISFFKKSDSFGVSMKKKFSKSRVFFSVCTKRREGETKNISMLEVDGRSLTNWNTKNHCFVDFNTDKIPIRPNFAIKNNLITIPLLTIGLFSMLYKHRPIWTKNAIEYHVPLFLKKYLKKLLLVFCYQFKYTNPFGKTWIRFGYDPRKEKRSVIYQTFNMKRKVRIEEKKITKHKQMCDIKSKKLEMFFNKKLKNQRNYINHMTGWLSDLSYIKIKSIIRSIRKKKSITFVCTS